MKKPICFSLHKLIYTIQSIYMYIQFSLHLYNLPSKYCVCVYIYTHITVYSSSFLAHTKFSPESGEKRQIYVRAQYTNQIIFLYNFICCLYVAFDSRRFRCCNDLSLLHPQKIICIHNENREALKLRRFSLSDSY